MKKYLYFILINLVFWCQMSCTSEPPAVCDCTRNNVRKETAEFDEKLQKKCDRYYEGLSENEKQHWVDAGAECLRNDPLFQKQLAEKRKKYYQSEDYLYGTWICVASGIGMRLKMLSGNTYLWQDDLNGFSTGTWQGTNKSLTFYEMGFPTGTGYIDIDGKMIHSVAGITLIFTKEN